MLTSSPSPLIEKVKLAMLSMQRDAWEQGVAAYRALRGGWIDEGYRAAADRMRVAVHARVDDEGLVQGVCGSPNFDHAGTATEGQAFFLLMEAAYQDVAR